MNEEDFIKFIDMPKSELYEYSQEKLRLAFKALCNIVDGLKKELDVCTTETTKAQKTSDIKKINKRTRELFKAFRDKIVPKPQVERYYFREDGCLRLVYDDGYEETRKHQPGLRHITKEQSLALKKIADEEAKDPYLIYLTKLSDEDPKAFAEYLSIGSKQWGFRS